MCSMSVTPQLVFKSYNYHKLETTLKNLYRQWYLLFAIQPFCSWVFYKTTFPCLYSVIFLWPLCMSFFVPYKAHYVQMDDFFFFLSALHGLWDLSFPNKEWTQATAVKELILLLDHQGTG